MCGPPKRNPGVANAGARRNDQLTSDPLRNTTLAHHLQVHRLVERFGLSRARADLVARLAWGAPA
jgi:hypothetical protein